MRLDIILWPSKIWYVPSTSVTSFVKISPRHPNYSPWVISISLKLSFVQDVKLETSCLYQFLGAQLITESSERTTVKSLMELAVSEPVPESSQIFLQMSCFRMNRADFTLLLLQIALRDIRESKKPQVLFNKQQCRLSRLWLQIAL